MNDWKQLQNGAEIRGVAMEGIIGEHVALTEEKVARLSQSFATWLTRQTGKALVGVGIGTDSRLTGPRFVEAAQNAITRAGHTVINCGLASTPAMQISTTLPDVKADGAIMFTGSHSPFNRNGMKFFAAGKDVTVSQLDEIIEIATQPSPDDAAEVGAVRIYNVLAAYAHRLREIAISDLKYLGKGARPLDGLKIIIDAGNGAGAFFATHVLRPLGADITGSQSLTPDGRFPNHVPNPDDYEAMRNIASAVSMAKADLGILFDADVDRVAIVDAEGHNINRNELVALTSAIVLGDNPGTKVVTDSITSTGLSKFIIEELGGRHCRYQRGYRNVIAEARRLNEVGEQCHLAIETSGHAAFLDNDFRDDGAYFALKLVVKLAQLKSEGRTLFSLIERLVVPLETRELRLPIVDNDFRRVASDITNGLRQYVSHVAGWEVVERNYDGLRVMCQGDDEQGWFICRLSLHDPVLPLNIESDVEGGVALIINKLKLFFRHMQAVDSTCLYDR